MKYLTYTVAGYMLLALIWWSVLLTRNNQALLSARTEAMQLKYGKIYQADNFDISNMPEYTQMFEKSERQHYMIIGEGIVFGVMLIIGIWFIQKSLDRELESAGKQKNFLLSVTHELKSPIASINLILQTLLHRDLKKEKSLELYKNALSESTRLEKLINNMLFTTKINTSYQYNLEPTDISQLTKENVQKFRFQYPDVHFQEDIAKDIQTMVDREAYVSLLINLLENAEKYTGSSKEISLSLHPSGTGTVILSVTDNGHGILPTEKDKVFDQFYRSGSEETRRTKGTGLGLYIVKKIVQAHKGKVRILDNQPAGSIIEVTLPLNITV
jgi:signal transduction histidine kinase